MDIRILLGNNIKNLRKTRNLSQEKLAEMIGIEPPALSKIENGKSYPTPQTLENIIKALNIKPEQLFILEEELDIEQAHEDILTRLQKVKQNKALFTQIYNKILEMTCGIE